MPISRSRRSTSLPFSRGRMRRKWKRRLPSRSKRSSRGLMTLSKCNRQAPTAVRSSMSNSANGPETLTAIMTMWCGPYPRYGTGCPQACSGLISGRSGPRRPPLCRSRWSAKMRPGDGWKNMRMIWRTCSCAIPASGNRGFLDCRNPRSASKSMPRSSPNCGFRRVLSRTRYGRAAPNCLAVRCRAASGGSTSRPVVPIGNWMR